MRLFTAAAILAALFVIGFAANPASANCHAKVEAARAKLGKVPEDYAKRQKIEKLIYKAEKFQDDKVKKKKCATLSGVNWSITRKSSPAYTTTSDVVDSACSRWPDEHIEGRGSRSKASSMNSENCTSISFNCRCQ